ncbi:hypothetical protein AVEN_130158-1 [Araneus ventricosus]|uniref:Uncharacterized protein n=1 Tax=Araneus ventricosus TaxID=182803 RepID=A0A4Y2X259_ARAVE|nr:hypothetical protein AVEN_130158-1 [Araneus ventricosus]
MQRLLHSNPLGGRLARVHCNPPSSTHSEPLPSPHRIHGPTSAHSKWRGAWIVELLLTPRLICTVSTFTLGFGMEWLDLRGVLKNHQP